MGDVNISMFCASVHLFLRLWRDAPDGTKLQIAEDLQAKSGITKNNQLKVISATRIILRVMIIITSTLVTPSRMKQMLMLPTMMTIIMLLVPIRLD